MTSKFEEKCCEIIERLLNKKFKRSYRPDFLKNPETGKNLELDMYSKELMLAIEVQGVQHFCYNEKNPAFGMTKEDFIKQVRRDDYKWKVCEMLGIKLIRIPYTFEGPKLEEEITKLLIKKEVLK